MRHSNTNASHILKNNYNMQSLKKESKQLFAILCSSIFSQFIYNLH